MCDVHITINTQIKNGIIWIQPVAYRPTGDPDFGPLFTYKNGQWCQMSNRALVSELDAVSEINQWLSVTKAQIWHELISYLDDNTISE